MRRWSWTRRGVLSSSYTVARIRACVKAYALRLRSADSSWLLRMEDRIGMIEPGRYADLAVLDRDYFSVADADIKKIQSVLTLVEGAIVHETPAVRGR